MGPLALCSPSSRNLRSSWIPGFPQNENRATIVRTKELEYPLDPPGWIPEARDAMLKEPFLHDRGVLHMTDHSGLGFEIDERALKKHGKHFFAMDRKRLVLYALRDRGLKAAKEIDATKRARTSKG